MGERRSILCLGDITWNTSLGPSISLKPVPLQSLSELERVRLQEIAFRRLIRCHDLGCHITIPKYGHKHKKSLRKKLDSLSKEKSRDKETSPQAFGIPLSHVITNDRVHKLRHEHQREEQSNTTELMLSFLHLSSGFKRPNKELSSSNSSLSSTPESHNDSPLPSTPDIASRTSRRGGVSVDCITDLDDNQARLLEALQLSLPDEAAGNRKKPRDKKLSLNPIYRQVPRIVDLCCQHLEKNGLQTVGIFRVGSSKKRVRQLREEFDQGWEVHLSDQHCVHDVAALLKKFLRDLPDPLLTRELYTAFIHTMCEEDTDTCSLDETFAFTCHGHGFCVNVGHLKMQYKCWVVFFRSGTVVQFTLVYCKHYCKINLLPDLYSQGEDLNPWNTVPTVNPVETLSAIKLLLKVGSVPENQEN